MDDFQEKLNSILGDPKMMQNIMSMAQSFGDSKQSQPSLQDIDLGMIQKLSKLAGQSQIDKREQQLLGALAAYLSRERIGKLEKAMKAAKLASLLGPSLQLSTGR